MNASYYDERLRKDMEQIQGGMADVAKLVQKSIQDALHSLLTMDRELAYETIIRDTVINRSIQQLDEMCHFFAARHLPTAGHYRYLSAVLRINIGLERIGDYAVTICRKTVQLKEPLDGTLKRGVKTMGEDALQMLKQACDAFLTHSVDMANGTKGFADQMERLLAVLFERLVQHGREGTKPIQDLLGAMVIFNMLERVSDQAKNICEETVFAVTGEMKQRKKYRMLFLSASGNCRSHMACSIAQRYFPNSGSYECAGVLPDREFDPRFLEFMKQKGYDLSQQKPKCLDVIPGTLERFHIIVLLERDLKAHIKEVPFYTALLTWDIPAPPEAEDEAGNSMHRFDEIHDRVLEKFRELMYTLRGKEAT